MRKLAQLLFHAQTSLVVGGLRSRNEQAWKRKTGWQPHAAEYDLVSVVKLFTPHQEPVVNLIHRLSRLWVRILAPSTKQKRKSAGRVSGVYYPID